MKGDDVDKGLYEIDTWEPWFLLLWPGKFSERGAYSNFRRFPDLSAPHVAGWLLLEARFPSVEEHPV